MAVVDVAAELLQDLEREREPCRRAADAVRVERDAGLVEQDADDAALRALPGGDGMKPDGPCLAVPVNRELD